MRGYNIYYKNNKINTQSILSKDDIDKITKEKFIYKYNKLTHKPNKIPTSALEIIPCVCV